MNRAFQGIFLLGLVALLFGGIAVLLQLRLDKGDAYPRYSTLRSDPLGARAFYETLQRLDDNGVKRNFLPLGREHPPAKTTWFFLGVSDHLVQLRSAAGDSLLRSILAQGGDVIIALRSGAGLLSPETRRPTTNAEADEAGEPETDPITPDQALEKRGRLLLQGLETTWTFSRGEPSLEASLTVSGDSEIWPATYQSRSPVTFFSLPAGWTTLYEHKGEAMVIQQRVGRGNLVVVNDSYAFSNEGLLHNRQSAFLRAVIGSNNQFIFDETHLGTTSRPGVIDLIFAYGLHGVLISFGILALLYIWRAGTPLLPPLPGTGSREDQLLGESSQEGFQHFLAHHVSGPDIVRQCFHEWQRSCGTRWQYDDRLAEKMNRALAELERSAAAKASPATQYNKLAEILTGKHFS